jgi:hypothetical protein
MTAYVILGSFIFWIVSVFASFLFGLSKGRKSERQLHQDELIRKEKDVAFYQAEKNKIMQEAFGNAEKQKAELSSFGGRGSSSREHFDAINDVMRQ